MAKFSKELREIAEDLGAWFPSETPEFRELVLRILAGMPGGDLAYEAGFEPLPIGWKEAELLGKLLLALQDPRDVAVMTRYLLRLHEMAW
jgi:hypothetical protein